MVLVVYILGGLGLLDNNAETVDNIGSDGLRHIVARGVPTVDVDNVVIVAVSPILLYPYRDSHRGLTSLAVQPCFSSFT
jgi:hypothetical protein